MTETILITGASSGFGEACARKFAADGYKLVLVARREDRLARLADSLLAQTLVVKADMTRKSDIESLVNELPSAFSEIDVLVNNAGLALGISPAQQADLEDWERMVDTNIKGLMWMTRFLLPGMVARNRGHIINIGSTAASWPYPGGNAYGGTKAFVQQFTRGLKADLAGSAVRVSNVEPGLANTEFSQVRFHGDQAAADKVYEGAHPLGAEDIADTVHWIARRPAHVNVTNVEIMPVCQAWNAWAVDRTQP